MRYWLLVGLSLLLGTSCSARSTPVAAQSGLLAYGQTVEQTLAGGQEHRWSFVGNVGDTVDITLAAEGISPALTLYGPHGERIQAMPGGSYQGAVLLSGLVLAASGPHTLVINASGGEVGRYSLSLQSRASSPSPETEGAGPPPSDNQFPAAPSQTPGATTPGPTLSLSVESGAQLVPRQRVQGRLSQPGEVDRYTLFGRANDVITLGMETVPGSAVDPYVEIYNPAGEVLTQADNSLGTPNAIITGLVLPATGAYIIFASDATGRNVGAYTIVFGDGLTMADHVQGRAEPETVYTASLSHPIIRDVWEVDLALGDVISAAVAVDATSPLDPVLSLVSPQGQVLYTDDNGGGGRNAALRQVIVPQTGRFLLAISPAAGASPGPYTLIWRYEAQALPTP